MNQPFTYSYSPEASAIARMVAANFRRFEMENAISGSDNEQAGKPTADDDDDDDATLTDESNRSSLSSSVAKPTLEEKQKQIDEDEDRAAQLLLTCEEKLTSDETLGTTQDSHKAPETPSKVRKTESKSPETTTKPEKTLPVEPHETTLASAAASKAPSPAGSAIQKINFTKRSKKKPSSGTKLPRPLPGTPSFTKKSGKGNVSKTPRSASKGKQRSTAPRKKRAVPAPAQSTSVVKNITSEKDPTIIKFPRRDSTKNKKNENEKLLMDDDSDGTSPNEVDEDPDKLISLLKKKKKKKKKLPKDDESANDSDEDSDKLISLLKKKKKPKALYKSNKTDDAKPDDPSPQDSDEDSDKLISLLKKRKKPKAIYKSNKTETSAAASESGSQTPDPKKHHPSGISTPETLDSKSGKKRSLDERNEGQLENDDLEAEANYKPPIRVVKRVRKSLVWNNTSQICFPEAVYKLVTETVADPDLDAIQWVEEGTAFMMYKEKVIPLLMKYFRHSKFSSLQRQLNMYGWSKHVTGKYKGAFFHPHFCRDMPTEDLFIKFMRRVPGRKPSSLDRTAENPDQAVLPLVQAPKKRRKAVRVTEKQAGGLTDQQVMEKDHASIMSAIDSYRRGCADRWERTSLGISSCWTLFLELSTDQQQEDWNLFKQRHRQLWSSFTSSEEKLYHESMTEADDFYSRLSFFAPAKYLEGIEQYIQLRDRRMATFIKIFRDGAHEFLRHPIAVQSAACRLFIENQAGHLEDFVEQETTLLSRFRRACSRCLKTSQATDECQSAKAVVR